MRITITGHRCIDEINLESELKLTKVFKEGTNPEEFESFINSIKIFGLGILKIEEKTGNKECSIIFEYTIQKKNRLLAINRLIEHFKAPQHYMNFSSAIIRILILYQEQLKELYPSNGIPYLLPHKSKLLDKYGDNLPKFFIRSRNSVFEAIKKGKKNSRKKYCII
jgi:hypothetical protein